MLKINKLRIGSRLMLAFIVIVLLILGAFIS